MKDMSVLDPIFAKAKQSRRLIALSEGEDPRIIEAALQSVKSGLARIVLIGRSAEVLAGLAAMGGAPGEDLIVMDPESDALSDDLASAFYELRKHKGMSPEKAAAALRQPLIFAAMMVRQGYADGTVGGAVATTADTVRAALQVLGLHPGTKLVSSFFLMVLDAAHHDPKRVVVFADCGLVVNPDATQMAAIAAASATSYAALMNDTPRVAMLSFSTKGSAVHADVTKVSDATQIAVAANPTLAIDGELQFDAAFVPSVAASKAKGSGVAGQANVFVFPNLDAGNISYKIAQRIGGARAIGPILQGLSKPANDLSRGCTTDDVFNMIAVTAAQVVDA
ncbi:MAG: phosphate acetyltransferase [Pseudorhodobacter sp.]|jgi:phosphate acetyltransferase